MKFTEKYKFRKPEGPDTYNVNDFNANWDINEAALIELQRFLLEESLTPEKVVQAIDQAVGKNLIVNVNRLSGKKASDFASAEQGRKADAALPLAGGTMRGAIDMAHFSLGNVAEPVLAGDAASKAYVDGKIKAQFTEVESQDSGAFGAWQWLENHWSSVQEGISSIKVINKLDGSIALFVCAKKNASHATAVYSGSKGEARLISLSNGTWNYKHIARTHADNLDSEDSEATLSANQGRALNLRLETASSNLEKLRSAVGVLTALKTVVKSSIVAAVNYVYDKLLEAEAKILDNANKISALDEELKKKVAKWLAVSNSIFDGHISIAVKVFPYNVIEDSNPRSFAVTFNVPVKSNYSIKGFIYEGERGKSVSVKRRQTASFELIDNNTRCKLTIADATFPDVWLSGGGDATVYVSAIYSYDKPAI